jgi:hypothetical protein
MGAGDIGWTSVSGRPKTVPAKEVITIHPLMFTGVAGKPDSDRVGSNGVRLESPTYFIVAFSTFPRSWVSDSRIRFMASRRSIW